MDGEKGTEESINKAELSQHWLEPQAQKWHKNAGSFNVQVKEG